MKRTASSPRPSKRHATPPRFTDRRERIRRLHETGSRGFTTSLRLTSLVDEVLTHAFGHGRTGTSMAVVSLGGYGRRELSFSSDVDIMVLVADEDSKKRKATEMRAFYHRLLDVGLDVGHSYRTIDDCLALLDTDLDAWLSLLDARFVCGDRQLSDRFLRAFSSSLKRLSKPDIIQRLIRLSDERHAKYGRSTKLLEPNIKNSSGGFRDIQTVLWLLRVTGHIPPGVRGDEPALRSLLTTSHIRSLFTPGFLRQARSGVDTLLRIRHQMHINAGTLHDTLEFSAQASTARSLRYRSAGNSTGVERFMRDYYGAAFAAAELHARVLDWAKDKWLGPKERSRSRSLGHGLHLRGTKMRLSPGARLSAETLLHAFAFRLSASVEFSFSLEDAIHRNLGSFRALRSKKDTELFCDIFRMESGTSSTLRRMNRYGLLARWIPEWRPLIRFFQHNQYHFYTADEHTLTVLEKSEALREDPSTFGETFRALPRRDVLYFACLFHDIAKPDRLEDHEITGARVASMVLRRLGQTEIADDVAFLVRHHLTMEQIAFRRNLGDPVTIREFASRFDRPELLQYLYVLTYADLASVNRNVLTDWKRSLLTELFMKASTLLSAGKRSPVYEPATAREALAGTLPKEDAEQHASLLLDDAYVRTFSRQEIAEHVEALKSLNGSATLFHHWSDITDVTLLTSDAPFVLARTCGVLYANDLSIIDARIFTRDDGVVVDRFRVVDSQTHRPLTEDRCRTVDTELREVLAGRSTVEELLERHRLRWKRRQRHVNPNVRVDAVFEQHPSFTIIDVYGLDTSGFLYRVADTLSREGCTIHFAKIATRGDGVVDAFYVLDRDGRPLASDGRRQQVREALLSAIRSMYQEQQEIGGVGRVAE